MNFKNKRVLVSGAGISGISSAILLRDLGARVLLHDNKFQDIESIEGVDIKFSDKIDNFVYNSDIIVISPGISIYSDFVQKAHSLGIPVIGEIELAYQICKHIPILAITGTNGKTTTTAMLGAIMQKANPDSKIVGNIGIPFSSIANDIKDNLDKSLRIISEISSYQLETIYDFKPKISAVLNITEDHLDRHITMENYIKSKERIFENQKEDDFLILNYDNYYTREMQKKAKAKAIFFSLNPLDSGAYIKDNFIIINDNGKINKILNLDEFKLLGKHNIENALAASLMAYYAGVNIYLISSTLKEFNSVAHRIEFVCKINGIDFFNDSKATNVDSAIMAIEAVSNSILGKIVLIAGGYDKGISYSSLIKSFNGRIRSLICIGDIKEKLYSDALNAKIDKLEKANSLDEAVDIAFKNAKNGDAVLFSPATSSFDMFENFEKRGDEFKKIVLKLKGGKIVEK